MRQNVIDAVKVDIEMMLKDYLREESINLSPPTTDMPAVSFDGFEAMALEGSLLYWEIRFILGILGKPWQCERLVDGIYRKLASHRPTAIELTTLLTSLHVEVTHFARSRVKKRATIRYIVGEC